MTSKHHIIPLHEWKRRINPKATRNNKDFNAPDNVVWLTIQQHAEAHKWLWEHYGQWEDYYAWQGISSWIGKEEIRFRIAQISGRLGGLKLKGKPKSEEHKRKLAISSAGNKNSLGWIMPQEQRDYLSKIGMGRKYSPETNQKRAEANRHPRGKYKTQPQAPVECPHCKLIGGLNPMRRWHFNNCKRGKLC